MNLRIEKRIKADKRRHKEEMRILRRDYEERLQEEKAAYAAGRSSESLYEVYGPQNSSFLFPYIG